MNRIFLFLLLLVPYVGFIWSSAFYFNHTNEKSSSMLLIKVCGLFTILANLTLVFIQNDSVFEFQVLGVVAIFISVIIFYWAIGSNARKSLSFAFTYIEATNLKTNGIYKYIRHPLYSSYTFAWIGGILINQHWLLVPTSLVLIFLYAKGLKQEEDGFLNGPNRNEYVKYMQTTGRFLPRIFS